MSVRAVLVLAVVGCALAGCGDSQGVDPVPHPDVSAAGSDVRLVDRGEADLVLHVSNQSFDDAEVRITVAVDGVTVVEDDFHVEDQHNWISFSLGLRPGVHEITATADSGASMRESFATPTRGTRYAVVDYWDDDHGPQHFGWLFQRKPLVFA